MLILTPGVIEAHAHAMRRAHRLLLILQPENLSDGPKLAETLEADGFAKQLLGKMKSFFGGRNGKNGARADA